MPDRVRRKIRAVIAHRGRKIALAAALLTVAVLVAAGIFLRRRIVEEYYVQRLPYLTGPAALALAEKLGGMGVAGRRAAEDWFLRQPEDSVPRLHAAERLGEFGSARAIPAILDLLGEMEAREGAHRVSLDPRA